MSDENNNLEIIQDNQTDESKNSDKANSNVSVLKFALIIIAIFLGTFAAVYTIVDMTMYKMGMQPFKILTNEFNKAVDDEFKYMKTSSSTPVKVETKDKDYVVTINMKSFGNDEDNFDVEITEKGIQIKGMYLRSKDGEKKENLFYQNIIFPVLIDSEKVKKDIRGNKMVLTIPFKESADKENRF
ncbi:MAG: Hsp20/alpha crystallin family protein [Candidatus Gastranaerophilales bacterium]|nr:Hsp20/alpha crystallin family protein [Candidatus Gastranaerophilales bacterium]